MTTILNKEALQAEGTNLKSATDAFYLSLEKIDYPDFKTKLENLSTDRLKHFLVQLLTEIAVFNRANYIQLRTPEEINQTHLIYFTIINATLADITQNFTFFLLQDFDDPEVRKQVIIDLVPVVRIAHFINNYGDLFLNSKLWFTRVYQLEKEN